MCRCIELMKEVVDKGDDLTACSALAAVHLSMAAIRCMQAELLSYAKIMDDDVFGYTIVREAELNPGRPSGAGGRAGRRAHAPFDPREKSKPLRLSKVFTF